MPAFSSSAPGKVILFGEHAVVYNRPAIAVPVDQVRARALVMADPTGRPGQVKIDARDIQLKTTIDRLAENHPIVQAIQGVTDRLGISALPSLKIEIHSSIPIASGLGSGAAVSVAISRALSAFLGYPLADDEISEIAFRVDEYYHGTPSGIDNTVITYAQPIYFIRDKPFEKLVPCLDFTIIIGNTGESCPTKTVVNEVRKGWQENPDLYERFFDEIGRITQRARQIILNGPIVDIGPLMTQNHVVLQELGVSSPTLDRFVSAAVGAGALGAKLCGSGRGGNMVALVNPDNADRVANSLKDVGAVQTIISTVRP